MRDNLRQYRAIRDALPQGYPGEPTGRRARHLATLAAFISGIVASKSTQLPTVASHVPDGTKPESRVKRLARWVGRVPVSCGSFGNLKNRVKYPHFSTSTRGFCHGLPSLFLPTDTGRPGVAVPHAPLGVAKRPRCR